MVGVSFFQPVGQLDELHRLAVNVVAQSLATDSVVLLKFLCLVLSLDGFVVNHNQIIRIVAVVLPLEVNELIDICNVFEDQVDVFIELRGLFLLTVRLRLLVHVFSLFLPLFSLMSLAEVHAPCLLHQIHLFRLRQQ